MVILITNDINGIVIGPFSTHVEANKWVEEKMRDEMTRHDFWVKEVYDANKELMGIKARLS